MTSKLRLLPPSLAVGLLACGLAIAAHAADAPAKATAKAAAKSAPAAKAAGKKAPTKAVDAGPPAATPEQIDAAEKVYYGIYDCEFNQTVDIEKSVPHAAYVNVRSGKSVWIMKPVLSSTGAIRLEDVKGETLMVQISSKSMLLNVKTARRIVDDCVSPKQRELVEAARAAKAAEVATAAEAARVGPGNAAASAATSGEAAGSTSTSATASATATAPAPAAVK
jgi:hypothetical protein